MRSSTRPIRGSAAAVMAAGAALALAAATPALAQDRDETRASGRSCYCVSTTPETFWTGPLSIGRARLGVYLSPEANDQGVRIERVTRRSGAEAAGLRAGDIITAINGRSVLEPLPGEEADDEKVAPAGRVSMLLRDVKPGDTVTVEYLRGGERRTAQVATQDAFMIWTPEVDRILERARGSLSAIRARPLRFDGVTFAFGAESRFGISVTDLSDDLGEYFGTREGVLVTRVDDDSPFDLRAGDVIQSVDGRKVRDAAHLRQILSSYREDETVKLEVLRRRQRVRVEGRAP
mgnify:CR=1 FL=1